MPVLVDPQAEAFAQQLAPGFSQAEAARRAGYGRSSSPNRGSRLMKRNDVQQRVAELRGSMSPQEPVPAITRQSLIDQAMEIKAGALADKDYSAANRALELIARVAGLLVERKETYNENVNWHSLDQAKLNDLLQTQISAMSPQDREKLLEEMPVEVRDVLDLEAMENGVYGKSSTKPQ